MVDRSYQQVRQVLVADEARARRHAQADPTPRTPRPVVGESARRYEAGLPDLPVRLEVDAQGRVTLPREWGVSPGAVFIARRFMGDMVLMDVRNASDLARHSGDSGVDGLIAERRWEAMREIDG